MTIIDLSKRDAPAAPDEQREDPRPIVIDQADEPADLSTRLGAWAARERRAVLPPWLHSRADFAAAVRMAATLSGSAVAYHAVRVPLYVLLAVVLAPRGAVRTVRRGWAWAADTESAPLRRAERDKRSSDTWLKLRADHAKVVRSHLPVTAAVVMGAVAAALFLLLAAPEPAQYAAAIALVALLGWLGQASDKPIITRHAIGDPTLTKPTSETIERALRSLPIAALSSKDARIEFPHPIRQDGPGWRADIDLPHGVTALDVIERRPGVASGLRKPLGCVWPEADPDAHAGRLILWVAMHDMAKARPAAYPLRRTGAADYFRGIPFGVDQRQRPVTLPLDETNTLIGSLPGGGKTAAARVVLAGCSLDPSIELHIWELKGSGDLESFARIAHSYGSGVDDETVEGAAAGLKWLRAEVGRRAERLKDLRRSHRDLVPDSKTTRELANRRSLGLHPIVYVIDEAQELFGHPDVGKQAGEDAIKVIKRGRAFGVHLIVITQRPDKDSLPTGVSANVGTRFCLRVMGQVENDMILGTSAYKNGIRSTTLRPSDKGIGNLVGASDYPTVVRTYYLDAAATDAVVARAHVMRERLGLLTGMAAGETVDFGEVVDVLADMTRIFATAEVMHTEDVLARLGELRPAVYGAWSPEALAAAMKPHGVRPGQVKAAGVNRNGYRAEWVREALSRGALEGAKR